MTAVFARVRRRLGEIRPAPPAAPVGRRAIYAGGVVGVGGLVGLAWINNAQRLAAAALVALVLGMLWVTFMAHRAVLTTAIAVVWWIGTAPAVGVFATSGLPRTDLYFAVSQATTTNVALGVVVWLTAVLTRAPRPATTIMACWALNFGVVIGASFVVPAQAWLVGYAVTVVVLAQRTGLLTRLRSGRARRGAADPHDPAQVAARDALDNLPPAHGIRCAAPNADAEHKVTLVVGPTGTYAVVALVTEEAVATVSNGTRLAAGPRRLDREIRAAARAASQAERSLRTPVRPVLLVAGGDFAEGLTRMAVRPTPVAQPMEVLVLRADLASGRLAHGRAVLTAGQVTRILRRIDASARSTPA